MSKVEIGNQYMITEVCDSDRKTKIVMNDEKIIIYADKIILRDGVSDVDK